VVPDWSHWDCKAGQSARPDALDWMLPPEAVVVPCSSAARHSSPSVLARQRAGQWAENDSDESFDRQKRPLAHRTAEFASAALASVAVVSVAAEQGVAALAAVRFVAFGQVAATGWESFEPKHALPNTRQQTKTKCENGMKTLPNSGKQHRLKMTLAKYSDYKQGGKEQFFHRHRPQITQIT